MSNASTRELEESRIRAAYAARDKDTRYSWFSPGHLFMVQERERHILELLRRHGCAELGGKQILEVGCGTGYWLRQALNWGARPENVCGVDLLADRVSEARRLCPPTMAITTGSASALPFGDDSFDIVIQSTMFTSIPGGEMRREIAREMLRVLRRDGLILWYDFHVGNPWNSDVRRVGKKEILSLFGRCHVELRRVTLAPPLARLLAPRCLPAARLLGALPFLTTHYLGVIRKR